jgi:hypothetical protein
MTYRRADLEPESGRRVATGSRVGPTGSHHCCKAFLMRIFSSSDVALFSQLTIDLRMRLADRSYCRSGICSIHWRARWCVLHWWIVQCNLVQLRYTQTVLIPTDRSIERLSGTLNKADFCQLSLFRFQCAGCNILLHLQVQRIEKTRPNVVFAFLRAVSVLCAPIVLYSIRWPVTIQTSYCIPINNRVQFKSFFIRLVEKASQWVR